MSLPKTLKFIALVTNFCFIVTTIAWTAPQHIASSIQIPQSLGRISDIYIPQEGEPHSDQLVIHIQDAHDSFSAQKNIDKIITHLNTHYGVNFVGVEGASGQLDLDMYRSFPFESVKRKVVDNHLSLGRLSGAEASAILSSGTTFIGVEDAGLFNNNYTKFLNYHSSHEESVSEFHKLKKYLKLVKKKYYSEDLKWFDKQVEAYKQAETTFIDYIGLLSDQMERYQIVSSEYLFFDQLINLASLRSQYKPHRVEKERRILRGLLILNLSQKNSNPTHFKLIQNYNVDEPDDELDYLMLLLAREHKITLQDYYNFDRHIQYVKAVKQLHYEDALEAIRFAEYQIKHTMSQNHFEQEIIAFEFDFEILEKIFLLKSTPKEVNYYFKYPERVNIERVEEFISKYSINRPINLTLLQPVFTNATEFYKTASLRDHALADNSIGFARENNHRLVSLVAGGYHTKGIVSHLKKKNIPYLVVTPEISSTDKKLPYHEKLLGKLYSFSSAIVSQITLVTLKAKGWLPASQPDLIPKIIQNGEKSLLTDLTIALIREMISKEAAERREMFLEFKTWIEEHPSVVESVSFESLRKEIGGLKENYSTRTILEFGKELESIFGISNLAYSDSEYGELVNNYLQNVISFLQTESEQFNTSSNFTENISEEPQDLDESYNPWLKQFLDMGWNLFLFSLPLMIGGLTFGMLIYSFALTTIWGLMDRAYGQQTNVHATLYCGIFGGLFFLDGAESRTRLSEMQRNLEEVIFPIMYFQQSRGEHAAGMLVYGKNRARGKGGMTAYRERMVNIKRHNMARDFMFKKFIPFIKKEKVDFPDEYGSVEGHVQFVTNPEGPKEEAAHPHKGLLSREIRHFHVEVPQFTSNTLESLPIAEEWKDMENYVEHNGDFAKFTMDGKKAHLKE